MEVVEQAWDEEINGSPMWRFHLKLKNTAKRLSEWSRNSIGNIFDKVNAELIRAVKKEENYWKQKAGIRCFILWRIGDGDSSFWWDNWTSLGPLSKLTDGRPTPMNIKVKDIISNGRWRWDLLSLLLPASVVNKIQRVEVAQSRKDWAYWTLENSGSFSTKSTWQQLRTSRSETFIEKSLWHKRMPFNFSFLMMRLLKNKVSTNERIQRVGIMIPSRCSCCTRHQHETSSHLFGDSDIARQVWNYFSGTYGIRHTTRSVRSLTMQRWLTIPKNEVHMILLQCLPSVIFWKIWKNGCATRFENLYMSRSISSVRCVT
uniref:Reverse transcriptase zinc-binding domain-containing protein n=1 Tax=Nicotiana tabacum TaxID=4097 RepID=A0A1S3YP38_TOBAC|nr:PREDICTED: uncharacterized protein LOC107778314 [Nicotiana tabacum]